MSTSEANTISTNSDICRPLVGEGGDVGQRASLLEQRIPQPPSLVLELIWNTSIVSVAILVVLILSKGETTMVPLRFWIVGFGILRVFCMVCVCLQYWDWRLVWGDNTTLVLDDNNRCELTASWKTKIRESSMSFRATIPIVFKSTFGYS